MANIASQIKRIKTNNKKNEINKGYKSRIRTATKKAETAIKNNTKEAPIFVNEVCSLMDKAVIKGIYHINKASNKKAKIMSKIATIKK